MVTVVKQPSGHKIIDIVIAGSISEDYSGDALITSSYHGLGTGDFIYLVSDIDEYNGFWYVTSINADTFKISEYATADFVPFYQAIDIEYYQTQEHVWNSIFLPIVYKVSSDLWPINTVDTARTISSVVDDNGFSSLTLSGAIKSFGLYALSFVKISGASNDSLNGVFQIVEVISTSEIVIDLAYDATNDFTGATIQYYYNNYQVKVKIYSGLPSTHPWTLQKPYEEVAELSLTPDDNGICMFSIADYIKSKVAIKNNPLIFSYPLNMDAFTGFYISIAETYDLSDGYSLSTSGEQFSDDDFEGYAVTGKLPFKNVYSGDYSDYVHTSGDPANWLTLLTRLIAVEDKYFDVSFIKNLVGDFKIRIDKYVADYLTATEYVTYTDQGIGVYRLPITADAIYDSFCISVATLDHTETVVVPPAEEDLSTYTQAGGGVDWTVGATLVSSITDALGSKAVGRSLVVLNGETLKVNYDITISYNNAHPPPVTLRITFFLSNSTTGAENYTQVDTTVSIMGSGVIHITGQASVTATADRSHFHMIAISGADEATFEINSISFGDSTTEEVAVAGQTVTEEICIDIIESCEAVGGFIPNDIRLTEDGDYRILE